jgi:hypothetical protein
VYRVRDTKLKRDVALKVLPATSGWLVSAFAGWEAGGQQMISQKRRFATLWQGDDKAFVYRLSRNGWQCLF